MRQLKCKNGNGGVRCLEKVRKKNPGNTIQKKGEKHFANHNVN